MTKQILTEFINPVQAQLTTATDNEGKRLWLKGIAVQGEIENANSRVYPREEINNAVNSIMKRITDNGPVPGELDHPEGLLISGRNVSHAIHSMRMEGNDGYAEMLVINAGNGKIVRGMIESGIRLGVSSRGSGSVDGKGRVSEFDIVSIDIVTTPSAPNAFPKPVYESLLDNRFGLELKYLAEIKNDPTVQRYFQKTLRDYLISIRDEVTWRKR